MDKSSDYSPCCTSTMQMSSYSPTYGSYPPAYPPAYASYPSYPATYSPSPQQVFPRCRCCCPHNTGPNVLTRLRISSLDSIDQWSIIPRNIRCFLAGAFVPPVELPLSTAFVIERTHQIVTMWAEPMNFALINAHEVAMSGCNGNGEELAVFNPTIPMMVRASYRIARCYLDGICETNDSEITRVITATSMILNAGVLEECLAKGGMRELMQWKARLNSFRHIHDAYVAVASHWRMRTFLAKKINSGDFDEEENVFDHLQKERHRFLAPFDHNEYKENTRDVEDESVVDTRSITRDVNLSFMEMDAGNTSNSRNNSHISSSNAEEDFLMPEDQNVTEIQLTLWDGEEEQKIIVPLNRSLKRIVTSYYGGRLRMVHNDKPLFLSSCGKKSLERLGIGDGDVIYIERMHGSATSTASNDNTVGSLSTANEKFKCNQVKKKIPTRRKLSKSKSSSFSSPSAPSTSQLYLDTTTNEDKVQHSLALTRVFEEVVPKFHKIRQELNVMNLERTPKQRKKSLRKNSSASNNNVQNLPVPNPSNEGFGGKAGKTHYVIHVGEVENLYKSTKPSKSNKVATTVSRRRSYLRLYNQSQQSDASSVGVMREGGHLLELDLHGLTRKEALERLDAGETTYLLLGRVHRRDICFLALPEWIDIAMKGSYPFVIQVVVICGAGSQVLSEAVENWIQCSDKVSKAPRTFIGRW